MRKSFKISQLMYISIFVSITEIPGMDNLKKKIFD